MHYIEIETVEEGPRLKWVAIYADSNRNRAIEWGHSLLRNVDPKPLLRITDGHAGKVVGAWQSGGWVEDYQ